MTTPSGGFDRVRRRRVDEPTDAFTPVDQVPDPNGRRVLFSEVPSAPPFPAVQVSCSSCGQSSLVGVREALGLMLPSLHLPFVRRTYSSWMRCPACDQRTWVRVSPKI